MKIAFIVKEFPSISETFILNQITGLLGSGHSVDIYADRPGKTNQVHSDVRKYNLLLNTFYYQLPDSLLDRLYSSVKVASKYYFWQPLSLIRHFNYFKSRKNFIGNIRLLHAAVPFLPRKCYDIIHCHFGSNGLLGMMLKEVGVLQGALITSFHGVDMSMALKKYGREIYRDLFYKGDLFLPISRRWEKKLVSIGCPKEKIRVHRMGVDLDIFKPTIANFRRQDDPLKIISVSRLIEKKGIEYALQACSSMVDRGFDKFKYTIVGDGEQRDYLQNLCCKLKLNSENVCFSGWQCRSEIIRLIEESDVFLAPSVTASDGDAEGIPVSIMEAMALGKPVIATRHSGIPEIVKDCESGFLVAEKDSDQIAEKFMACFEDRDWIESMGKVGRDIVGRHFNVKNLNKRLVEIYKMLISEKHQRSGLLSRNIPG